MWSFKLTEDEDFNVHGAFAILELAGESDLAESLRCGDWRVMPQVYQALRKGVINQHDVDLIGEAEEHVQDYYNLLGRYLGVFPRDIDEVPIVLQNLHKHVDDQTKTLLSDLLRQILAEDGSGYLAFLGSVSELDITDTSGGSPYMVSALMECSRVVIDGMNLEVVERSEESDIDE